MSLHASPVKAAAARCRNAVVARTHPNNAVSSPSKVKRALDYTAQASIPAMGHLHLIMGPMFAGKTTSLLQHVARCESNNKTVALVTSSLDTRYGAKKCASHNGSSRDAIAVRNLKDLMHADRSPPGWDIRDVDVIAIDESQFFPDLREFCLYAVETEGKEVYAAGLNGDFKRETFGDIVAMVPLADSVEFLNARCQYCEMPAAFTLRLVVNDTQQLVGGKDVYQPVCRFHHAELRRVEPVE